MIKYFKSNWPAPLLGYYLIQAIFVLYPGTNIFTTT